MTAPVMTPKPTSPTYPATAFGRLTTGTPTSLVALPWRDAIPRGGMAREVAVVGMAATLLQLQFVEGDPGMTLVTTAPTGADAPNTVVFGMAGTKYNVGGLIWDLTGQPVVPPNSMVQYLLLFDGYNWRTGIYPSQPVLPGSAQQGWVPNGPEALIDALNRGYGFSCMGFITVVNGTTAPWTPGTAFPANPAFTANAFGGVPGDMLLPFANVGQPTIFIKR